MTLSPFLIAKTEVTQEQWFDLMGTNPSFNAGQQYRGGDVNTIMTRAFPSSEERLCNRIDKTAALGGAAV